MDAQRHHTFARSSPREAPPMAEEYFSLAGARRLVLSGQGVSRDGSRYLAHRIVDNPNDLRAHVQRIFLLLASEDEVTLRASLVDLFIVLGDKGHALKVRMLDYATPQLSRTVAAFLRKHLQSGFKPWDRTISGMRMSLLSLGYIGTRELVRRRHATMRPPLIDGLAPTRGNLEYGHLEVAIESPEAANEAFPDDWEVVTALEEFHHHDDDDRDDRSDKQRRAPEGPQRIAQANVRG